MRRDPLALRLLCILVLAATGAAAQSAPLARKGLPPMFDARLTGVAAPAALKARGLQPASAATVVAQLKTMKAAAANLQREVPGAEVRFEGLLAAPSMVAGLGAPLTKATPGARSVDVALGFVRDHAALYGLSGADVADLVVLGDSPGGASGLRMVRLEQQVDGIAVFDSETRFLLRRDGALDRTLGTLVPHARAAAGQAKALGWMPPEQATASLVRSLGHHTDAALFTATTAAKALDGNRVVLSEQDDYVAGEVTARKVYFPLAPGLLVPAWSLVVFTTGDEDWYAVVDARSGDVLWRKNMRDWASSHDARFRVYVQADGTTPADSPAPQSPNTVAPGSGTQFPEIAPTVVSMHTAYDATASPNGWIDDCPAGGCTANETQTLGNNVLACLDQVGGGNANVCDTAAATVLDGNGRPTGNADANSRNRDFLGTTPRDFQTNFLPPPQGGNPEAGQTCTGNGNNGTLAVDQFRRGMVTQLFYISNWYHDRLYELGFDEASGNFQQTNFSGMGAGNDRVNADADDGSGTNNANFATPPDGTPGRMQMFRFTGPTIDRDGSLDAEIVMHELTHGVSNRLVSNANGLLWDEARGMGEGWSDFVALSLLNNTNADSPIGHYASGAYATYKLGGLLDNYVYGIRRFPYTTDHSVNPMTWADVDDVTNNLSGGIAPDPLGFNLNGGEEVHNSGEIWALTLWGVRARIIADPAGANGDVPTGNHTALQLVINGLKMTPKNPSFLDARDAILAADCATNACANEQSIWDGFADRGLGYRAVEPYKNEGRFVRSHVAIGESFKVPYLDVVDPLNDVTVDDSAGNNNGAVDPGEPVKLTVKLTNPWRATGKAVTSATATLATSTTGVTIWDASSTYGAIAAQGSATGDTFLITVDPSVPCGSAIDFTLTTTSSLGTTVATFRVRVGKRNGTDPVVTYTGNPNPDLTITSNRPRGVFHQINVTDDFEIADLDFRLDSITHPAVGDLSAMLRSPDGVGTDFVVLIDGLNDLGGTAITNMVIDDDVASTAGNDMVQATSAAAPYTKSWLPVYNSPWITLVSAVVTPDPIGGLSRFDGHGTKGTWSAHVADLFSAAGGGADGNGTFNAWSMLVTPVHFDCVAFAPAVSMSATKTVSGSFVVGGTVTYTVTLTNSGTAAQNDNAGHEFDDMLPAGLTLVSASATSGTATTSGNTVDWDGSLAPLGGSVTITITATVNAGTQGTTITNQGLAYYDSDANNTNDANVPTDDPAVGGAIDPTAFTVGSTALTATKTVSAGPHVPGSTVTYTVTLTNVGTVAQPDNAGHEFTDALPAGITLVSATATSGTAVVAGNTVTWDGTIPAAASVTITITATIDAGTLPGTLSNQGTASYASDGGSTNDSSALTDDPAAAGKADPTNLTVTSPATIATHTKTVSGSFPPGGPAYPGAAITYTVVISNSAATAQFDNPGDEFTDVLPAGAVLVSASATSGTAVADVPTNTVHWNGALAANGGAVTVTIQATVAASASGPVSNQGTVFFDADGDGTNESSVLTDDPSTAAVNDPTTFAAAAAGTIPTLSQLGTLLLGLLLAGAALLVLRLRG